MGNAEMSSHYLPTSHYQGASYNTSDKERSYICFNSKVITQLCTLLCVANTMVFYLAFFPIYYTIAITSTIVIIVYNKYNKNYVDFVDAELIDINLNFQAYSCYL